MKQLKQCKCCPKPSKYKCPKCDIRYPVCFKIHQCVPILKTVQQPIIIQTNINEDYIEDEQLRLPRNKLKRLRNAKMKSLLDNKQTRRILQNINGSRQRIKQLQNALGQQQFRVLADQILNMLGVIDEEGRIK